MSSKAAQRRRATESSELMAAGAQRNIQVTSEIGPLQAVICHTPGTELLAVTPANREDFLYDDIIDLDLARREHQRFTSILSRFAEVHEVTELLCDIIDEPEVREAFTTILAQGWTDAVRALHPDEVIYTFWDYFRNAYGRNAGLRIDHFLLNPVLKKSLRSCGVDKHVRGWEKTSDHAPVWIELKHQAASR